MNFKVGDKVKFIRNSKIWVGTVMEFTNQGVLVEYNKGGREDWSSWVRQSELALVKLPVVPRYVSEWIMQGKLNGKNLLWVIDMKNPDMWNSVFSWLENNTENQHLFARAWMEGHEVEKEPRYYIKLVDSWHGFINLNLTTRECSTSNSKEFGVLKTKFTEQEIKAIDERYWQFAVSVEEEEEN
ncbi:gp42 [Listeria phage P40]|uniref:gp42 n=1 Tax=Listeria phage P40 TaxID=560178 RepID=UPI00018198F7|nr:gp42 [Listeria phage P40]ACI00402.1 gp42 [Listeria phage P40]